MSKTRLTLLLLSSGLRFVSSRTAAGGSVLTVERLALPGVTALLPTSSTSKVAAATTASAAFVGQATAPVVVLRQATEARAETEVGPTPVATLRPTMVGRLGVATTPIRSTARLASRVVPIGPKTSRTATAAPTSAWKATGGTASA